MPSPPIGPVVLEQLELLSHMIEDIAGELALEPLLDRIVERACHLIGADDGLIGLYVPDRDVIRTAASYRIPPQGLAAEMPRGYGLTGRVLEIGAPIRGYYHDLPRVPPDSPEGMYVIGMPIRARNRLIGVFGVGVHGGRTLDEHAQDMLALFARHAGVAIDNAQRYSEEKRRAARFALISRVVAISASDPKLDNLLQQAADAIHETLEYPNVDIPLIDPEAPDTLVIRIRGGEYKRRIQHEDRLPTSVGIMGAAVTERRIQLVNDVANDARYITPPGMKRPQAELAIPILHGEQALGVLNLESDVPFDELDCSSLEIVAEHLGVAIVNARLFERSTEAALLEERQRLARDLHDNVTQILSSMSLITQSLSQAWREDPAEGERRVERLGELSRLAFGEMRGLLQELYPHHRAPQCAAVNQPPFPTRLRRLLSAMVPGHVQLQLNVGRLPDQHAAHEDALLRVCQEAVSNAVRHGAPANIGVRLATGTRHVRLTVDDDGSGIPDGVARGMGLENMRVRLSELGGRLRISARAPKGTRIQASLPRNDRTPR